MCQPKLDMNPTLIDSLCAYFCSSPRRLATILNNPLWVHRANIYLRGKTLRTLHLKERNKEIKFGVLSSLGANKLMAMEGFCDGLTVKQYFYVKHGILLDYAKSPCVVVFNANGPGHNAYYPLEVLTIANC